MSDVAQKIKSKGYWSVVIRPGTYLEDRVSNFSNLFPLARALSVQIRGWDFPHIDSHSTPELGARSVSQELDWNGYIERWRMYQSGQFVYHGAFWYDWDDWKPPDRFGNLKGGPFFLIEDCVARYSEFMEFASRLSLSPAGDQRIFVEIGAHALSGRQAVIQSPRRGGFFRPRGATIPEFMLKAEFDREQLVAESKKIALEWARELFRRFDWDPSDEILESIREEYR